ncbi:MAG: flagellar motor switch protein FliG [Legionellales bacterium]
MASRKNAAIILLGMGENYAAEILKILDHKEVESIIEVMNNIDDVSEHEIIKALNDFFKETQVTSGLHASSGNYLRNTLVSAMGSEKADMMMNVDTQPKSNPLKGLELIKWQPVHHIVSALQDEHPQLITITLMCIESEQAANILKLLPKTVRKDVITRMTHSNPVSQYAMNALSTYLEEQFTKTEKFKLLTSDGINLAANIIAQMDVESENEVMTSIGEEYQEMNEKLQEKLFPFEKLAQMDKRSLQTFLAELDNNDLILALKGSDDELKERFFQNMSAKSAELLKEDIETKGPVKLSLVLEAQKRIVNIAKKLIQEEKIFLTSTNDNTTIR